MVVVPLVTASLIVGAASLGDITKLGRILNLSVTAEGVETHDQAESLKAMACTHFQGFHFGRPLGPADLSAYLLRDPLIGEELAEGLNQMGYDLSDYDVADRL